MFLKTRSMTFGLASVLFLAGCVDYDKEGNVDQEATRQMNESFRASMEAMAQATVAGVQAYQESRRQPAQPCARCGGSGFVFCTYCQGAGGFACMACGGRGFAYGFACASCGGRGGFSCAACAGSGRVPCPH
jgi:DnaJ-class molecular chaperone